MSSEPCCLFEFSAAGFLLFLCHRGTEEIIHIRLHRVNQASFFFQLGAFVIKALLLVHEPLLFALQRFQARQFSVALYGEKSALCRLISPTQEAAFLSFVQHDKVYQKYYDEIIILLGTGLRISELCGLTEADIDLDKQLINVDHQLLKIADVGYYVETPKTKSGNRVIPMSEKVLEAFQRVLNKRKYVQPVILEGYTKFLFLNRNGLPKVAVNYESMFRGLVRKYNKTQKVALPKVMTPHTLRHTFCTTLANAGMNPKALQYIMGHSNINMTLNYYAHTTSETSITEMKRLIA